MKLYGIWGNDTPLPGQDIGDHKAWRRNRLVYTGFAENLVASLIGVVGTSLGSQWPDRIANEPAAPTTPWPGIPWR